jgi:hypothetical protein
VDVKRYASQDVKLCLLSIIRILLGLNSMYTIQAHVDSPKEEEQ